MGIRFRKRIKILPGIHVNISKSGTSLNVGPRGANVSIGKNGTYLNAGIPGTGIYSRERISKRKQTRQDRQIEATSNISQGEESFIGVIILFIIFSLIGGFISYKLFSNGWGLFGTIFTLATLICIVITIFAVYWEATRKSPHNESPQISKNQRANQNSKQRRGNTNPSQELDKTTIDNEIKSRLNSGLYLPAIDYCRINTSSTYEEAKNYVDLIASKMSEQNNQ